MTTYQCTKLVIPRPSDIYRQQGTLNTDSALTYCYVLQWRHKTTLTILRQSTILPNLIFFARSLMIIDDGKLRHYKRGVTSNGMLIYLQK